MDFLDALAQTTVGVAGLAAVNHFSIGEGWHSSLLYASLFMFCFWLGRFTAEQFSRMRRQPRM